MEDVHKRGPLLDTATREAELERALAEAQFGVVPATTHGGRVYPKTSNTAAEPTEVAPPAPRPNRRQRRRGAALAQRAHVRRQTGG